VNARECYRGNFRAIARSAGRQQIRRQKRLLRLLRIILRREFVKRLYQHLVAELPAIPRDANKDRTDRSEKLNSHHIGNCGADSQDRSFRDLRANFGYLDYLVCRDRL
jgi:hypothetical protein